jgi:hypothetical protein
LPSALRIRVPRSAPTCLIKATPKRSRHDANAGWSVSGAHQSSTVPTIPAARAAAAVASVRSISCAWTMAASASPIVRARRVFTAPGTGAFANICNVGARYLHSTLRGAS